MATLFILSTDDDDDDGSEGGRMVSGTSRLKHSTQAMSGDCRRKVGDERTEEALREILNSQLYCKWLTVEPGHGWPWDRHTTDAPAGTMRRYKGPSRVSV